MNERQLIYILINFTTTVFAISFAAAYFFIVPDIQQQRMSNEELSGYVAWLFSIVVVEFVSLAGSAANLIKMFNSQSKKMSEAINSVNPFYRLKIDALNDAGRTARRHFFVFLATFLIAAINGFLMLFLFRRHF